ncbi:MAG TPA: N-acetyltransferase [Flavobacteriaceae bacterium]|nr:GNAT family N-acetyltransferase [Flavobacteriaceae bacterium]HAT66362.1 N-acetyltransferase [Flavobacteriaceae bacterium]|tara:strand:- start:107973 stop:108794 length:822 start_codon:yes stop_codon:yes gene_type:complete
MQIKNLGDTPFHGILSCFFSAFENYFVAFPKDENLFRKRWEMAKIDYKFSYGMFDNDTLVGFILHAIDVREGQVTAFNLATGVIPEYRGKGITNKIYEYALNELKHKGVTKCKLEVIKENINAIKAYKRVGFEIVKGYKCFAGKIEMEGEEPIGITSLALSDINLKTLVNQSYYSWENQIETIQSGDYKLYQVIFNNQVESYFIINENGYIPQFETVFDNEETWKRLFTGIGKISKTIKINNIDEQLEHKISQVLKFGLANTIDQYEMELLIK